MKQPKNKFYRLGEGLLIIAAMTVLTAALLHLFNADAFVKLMLLRVPLISGLFLFTLPVIAFYLLPSMLENLFVLESPYRLAVVILQSAATGLGIVFVWLIIDYNTDCRFYSLCSAIPLNTTTIIPYLIALFLALPVSYAAWSMSEINQKTDINKKLKMQGVAAGGIAVLVIYYLIYALRQGNSQLLINLIAKPTAWLLKIVLPENQRAGFINASTDALADGHLLALCFMLITVAIYVICYFIYRPSPTPGKRQAPALYYVLVLIVPFSFILGLMTFFLDYYRIPSILVAALISWAGFYFFKTDHFFKITPIDNKQKAKNATVQEALKNRLALNKDGTLVVVCASGGGIQAAGWTTMVLTKLQELLGESFANAIGLISSVSGGSVGAMYYLDSMSTIKNPNKNQLLKIFQSSTTNSLDATGWGLAYPDLWRIMGAPFLPSKLNDRGEAIENSWKTAMYTPEATYESWQSSMSAGQLPICVFNSTQVEQGKRLLLSPISFSRTSNHDQIDFNSLYQNHTLEVTAAARLSASFAYVSPIARDSLGVQDFHAADGGYFDNYGVFTANQWLTNEVLPDVASLGVKRIIYIQIRAFPVQPKSDDTEKKSASGWVMALFGPILTLANVRNATQNVRNEYDMDIMAECQSKGIDFQPYTFQFPSTIPFFETKAPHITLKTNEKLTKLFSKLEKKLTRKNYAPPLSWKLSQKQKDAITKGWEQIETNPKAVSYSDLKELQEKWKSLS